MHSLDHSAFVVILERNFLKDQIFFEFFLHKARKYFKTDLSIAESKNV
jgi:hypothetical protein